MPSRTIYKASTRYAAASATLCAVLLAAPASASSRTEEAQRLEVTAINLRLKHRGNDALSCIERAISLSPQQASLYVTKAQLLMELIEGEDHGASPAALESIQTAERLGDNSTKFYVTKGTILSSVGRDTEAIACLDKALRNGNQENRSCALITKARIWAKRKEFAQAAKLIEPEARAGRLSTGTLADHAQWCIQAKLYDQAISDCQMTLLRQKGQATHYAAKQAKTLLAKAYDGAGKTTEAREAYIEILKAWPDDRKLLDAARLFFLRTGDKLNQKRAETLIDEFDQDMKPF